MGTETTTSGNYIVGIEEIYKEIVEQAKQVAPVEDRAHVGNKVSQILDFRIVEGLENSKDIDLSKLAINRDLLRKQVSRYSEAAKGVKQVDARLNDVVLGLLAALKTKASNGQYDDLPVEMVDQTIKSYAGFLATMTHPESKGLGEAIEESNKKLSNQYRQIKNGPSINSKQQFLMAAAGVVSIGSSLFLGHKKEINSEDIEVKAAKEPTAFQKIGNLVLRTAGIIAGTIAVQAAVQKKGFSETAKEDYEILGKWTDKLFGNTEQVKSKGNPLPNR